MDSFKNILDEQIFDWYPNKYPFKSFINSVANNVDINGVISVAGLFHPDFIEFNGYILLKENVMKYVKNDGRIPSPFGKDVLNVERYNNLFNLDEYFLLAAEESSKDIRLLNIFGNLIIYFWSVRLKELFPLKEFEFEIAENLYDEDGLCLTFCQKNQ